jgi:hypothetical protein
VVLRVILLRRVERMELEELMELEEPPVPRTTVAVG